MTIGIEMLTHKCFKTCLKYEMSVHDKPDVPPPVCSSVKLSPVTTDPRLGEVWGQTCHNRNGL